MEVTYSAPIETENNIYTGQSEFNNLGAVGGRSFFLTTYIWPSGFGRTEFVQFTNVNDDPFDSSPDNGKCIPEWNTGANVVNNASACRKEYFPCTYNYDVTDSIESRLGGTLVINAGSLVALPAADDLPCRYNGTDVVRVKYEISIGIAQPTPAPTESSKSRACPNGEYFQPQEEACTMCDAGKSSSYEGGVKSQNSLDCKDCASGMTSSAGASACTTNEAGSFSDAGVSTPCPLATYAHSSGSRTACTQCPGGQTTPKEGATSEDECTSPVFNFVMGVVVLIVSIPLGLQYVVRGRFHRVAFVRHNRVLKQLIQDTHNIISYVSYFDIKAESERILRKSYRRLLTWVFIIVCALALVSCSAVFFLAELGEVIFKSMILLKSLQMEVAKFGLQVKSVLVSVGNALGGKWVDVVTAPFVEIIEFFSYFKIDLKAVQVTCQGSAAPFELSFNMFILGASIVLIQGNFQSYKLLTYDIMVKLTSETDQPDVHQADVLAVAQP